MHRALGVAMGLLVWACAGSSGPGTTPASLDACGGGDVVAFLAPAQVMVPSGGQFLALSGVAFGDFAEVRVLKGDALVGTAETRPFFELAPTPLDPGPNRFVLQGRRADGTIVEDAVTAIYTPEGIVPPATVTPDYAIVGVLTAFFFRFDLSRMPVVDPVVELWEADADGTPVTFLGTLVDDGNLTGRGDELAGDQVWSVRVDLTFEAPATRSFVAVVTGRRDGQPVERASSRVDVRAVQALTADDCTTRQAVLADLRASFEALRAGQSFDDARAALVAEARANPLVAQAGADACADGVWVRFVDGVLGVVPLASWREAGSDPAPVDYGNGTWSTDRALERRTATLLGQNDALAAALAPDACPSLLVDAAPPDPHTLPYDWSADLGAGVLYLQGEGDLAFGALDPALAAEYGLTPGEPAPLILLDHDEVCRDLGMTDEVCSFDPANPSASQRCVSYGKECVLQREREDGKLWGACLDRRVRDLRLGRLVLTPTGYGLTPGFLREALPDVDAGVALLDVPRAGHHARLAAELLRKGYSLVAARAARGGTDPFPALASALLGQDPWGPADHPGLRLFGTVRVGVPLYGVSNGTFEQEGLAGWRTSGDARRVASFAGQTPVEGKGMAVLSTGLGFTEQGGVLEQVFCPEPGTRTLRFYWRLFSEEFVEECGYQEYQDEIVASLFVGGEETRVLDASINQLCPADQDVGVCGVCQDPNPYNCPCGALNQEDDLALVDGLHFDQPQGDVWGTAWREASILLPFAGIRPVHVRLEVRDRGDSHLDTAVLLDRVEMQ